MTSPSVPSRGPGRSQASSTLPPPRIGPPPALTPSQIDPVVLAALDEDRGAGDITSDNAVPADAEATARLRSKARGRIAGVRVFTRVFELCDPQALIEVLAADGDEVVPGQELIRIRGNARALLLAERTALNLMQRMSGIATRTARLVKLAGPNVRLLDTRKTTPGLRLFEKYAVRCGGGENHRVGLYDEVMLKDNHIDLAGRSLPEVLADVRRAVGPSVRITAEARDEAEALAATEGGADVVMLDNMSPAEMQALCPRIRALAARAGRSVEIEASGGITEETIGAVAASGVDRISVGALTHSVPALDLSLALEPLR